MSFLYSAGDTMMYQHSVSGVGCTGSSPTTTTPPNINSCSSVTPPISNNQQNPSQNDVNSEQMVRIFDIPLAEYSNLTKSPFHSEHFRTRNSHSSSKDNIKSKITTTRRIARRCSRVMTERMMSGGDIV